jgi:hypothetical protein
MTHQNDPERATRTGMRTTPTGSNVAMILGLAALVVVGAFLLWPRSEPRDALTQNKQIERPTMAPTTATPPATAPAPTTTSPEKAPAQ